MSTEDRDPSCVERERIRYRRYMEGKESDLEARTEEEVDDAGSFR